MDESWKPIEMYNDYAVFRASIFMKLHMAPTPISAKNQSHCASECTFELLPFA